MDLSASRGDTRADHSKQSVDNNFDRGIYSLGAEDGINNSSSSNSKPTIRNITTTTTISDLRKQQQLQRKDGNTSAKSDSAYLASTMCDEDDGMYGCDDDADAADEDLSEEESVRSQDNNISIDMLMKGASPLKEDAAASIKGVQSKDSTSYGHDKRRQDKNSREKERTYKIAKQIDELKEVLVVSGIKVKRSKYSVLEGTADYISTLQEKYAEMCRELKSIAEYSETKSVISRARASEGESEAAMIDEAIDLSSVSKYVLFDASTLAYDDVFRSSPMPIGITTLDGKFIDCNDVFLSATRQPKETFLRYPLWEFIEETSRRDVFARIDQLSLQDSSSGTISNIKSRIKFASDGSSLYFSIFLIRDEETREPSFLSVFVTHAGAADQQKEASTGV